MEDVQSEEMLVQQQVPVDNSDAPVSVEEIRELQQEAVEQQQQEDIEELKQETEVTGESPNPPRVDLVDLLFEGTALQQNADSQFLFVSGQSPVKSYDRSPEISNYLHQLLLVLNQDQIAIRELFVKIANEGNFVELQSELERQLVKNLDQQVYGIWQQIARALLRLARSQLLHFKRVYISRVPFVQRGSETVQDAVNQIKEDLMRSIGIEDVDISNISWDALSYKIPPTASEYFCQILPHFSDQLSQAQLSIIDEMQDKMWDLLLVKLAERRKDAEGTRQDDFISDVSQFLETRVGAKDDQQRQMRIATIGDPQLIRYVAVMQPMFAAGFVPGTIPPSKISACQDVVSATETRGAIQFLAQEQIIQKDEMNENPNIRSRMKVLADEQMDMRSRWSKQQTSSIQQGLFIDKGYNLLGRHPQEKQRALVNQIAGGGNELIDQLNMQRHDGIVDLTAGNRELLRQQLSVMLACLRIRFDAVQSSRFELVLDEDIEHLEICRRLSQYCDPDTQRTLYEYCTVMEEAMVNGHNRVKLKGYGLDDANHADIDGILRITAQNILQTIPVLQSDSEEGAHLMTLMMDCVYLALANKNRIDQEVKLRLQRRLVMYDAASRYGIMQ